MFEMCQEFTSIKNQGYNILRKIMDPFWQFNNESGTVQFPEFQDESLGEVMRVLEQPEKQLSEPDMTYNTTKPKETSPALQKKEPEFQQKLDRNKEAMDFQRKKTQIQVRETIIEEYLMTFNGKAGETLNLNKYIHERTLSHLQNLKLCKSLTSEQEAHIDEYKLLKPSLDNQINFLESHPSISERCDQLYSSSEFIKDVLESKKMFFERKVSIIKHLKKLKTIMKKSHQRAISKPLKMKKE